MSMRIDSNCNSANSVNTGTEVNQNSGVDAHKSISEDNGGAAQAASDGVSLSQRAAAMPKSSVVSLDECGEAGETAGVEAGRPEVSFTREDAAQSLVTMGKGGDLTSSARSIKKYLNKQYGVNPVSDYGIETNEGDKWYNDAADNAGNWVGIWNSEENSGRFISAGAFSRAGETMMYAEKMALENGQALPDVILHVDDVVYQKKDLGFSALNGLDMGRVEEEGKAAYKASSNGKNMAYVTKYDDNDKPYKAADSSSPTKRAGYASAFVNGTVSAQRDQCVIYSTTGEGGPTKSAAFLNPIYEQLCEAEDYSQFGFELPEGVTVVNVYQDNSYATFVDENGNFTDDNITSDNVYVIQYSDGTQSEHELVGTKFNHDGINNTNSYETADIMLAYQTAKGNEYYGNVN